MDGGNLAHRQLGQEYLGNVPAEQQGYVDLGRTFTNPVTGGRFRPDVVNHWTGEVIEYKPQSWNGGGYLTRMAEDQLQGYLNALRYMYGDWRRYEGLSEYQGRVQYYDPLKYNIPE